MNEGDPLGDAARRVLADYDDCSGAEPSLSVLHRSIDVDLRVAVAADDLKRERDEARAIVRDIYWMAIRYADGRKSYAVGMCNDAVRKAYEAGWLAEPVDPKTPKFARDGMCGD